MKVASVPISVIGAHERTIQRQPASSILERKPATSRFQLVVKQLAQGPDHGRLPHGSFVKGFLAEGDAHGRAEVEHQHHVVVGRKVLHLLSLPGGDWIA
jgi:hypothetical protein